MARRARPPLITIGGRPLLVGDVGVHLPQWRGHAFHRSAHERCRRLPSVESRPGLASSPASRRIAAPLLPRSSGTRRGFRPSRPTPSNEHLCRRPACAMFTPSSRMAAVRRAPSSLSRKRANCRRPLRQCSRIVAQSRNRLVAGHAQRRRRLSAAAVGESSYSWRSTDLPDAAEQLPEIVRERLGDAARIVDAHALTPPSAASEKLIAIRWSS